jgi:hypothetical protein
MQSYPLDLTTILYLLEQQQQGGLLQATLAAVPGAGEPCLAQLTLVSGKVTACFVETRSGRLVAEGRRALTLLGQLGTIDWVWQPENEISAPRPRQAVPPGGADPWTDLAAVPRQREPVRMDVLQTCSRLQRRVLGLADGRRSVSEIAAILAVPPDQMFRLQEVLRELQALGLLTLTRPAP